MFVLTHCCTHLAEEKHSRKKTDQKKMSVSPFTTDELTEKLRRGGRLVVNLNSELTGDIAFDILCTESIFIPDSIVTGALIICLRTNDNIETFTQMQIKSSNMQCIENILNKSWIMFYRDKCLMGDYTLTLDETAQKICAFVDSPISYHQFSYINWNKVLKQVRKITPINDITNYRGEEDIFLYSRRISGLTMMLKTSTNLNLFHYYIARAGMDRDAAVPINIGWLAHGEGTNLYLGTCNITEKTMVNSLKTLIQATESSEK